MNEGLGEEGVRCKLKKGPAEKLTEIGYCFFSQAVLNRRKY